MVNLLKKRKVKAGIPIITSIRRSFIQEIYKTDVISISYMPSDINIEDLNVDFVSNEIINIEYEVVTKNFIDEIFYSYVVQLHSKHWAYIVLNNEIVVSQDKNEIIEMFCEAGNISLTNLDKVKLTSKLNLSLEKHQLNEIHKIKI